MIQIRNSKHFNLLLLICIFALLFFVFDFCYGAILYLEPSTGQYQPERTFGIEIKIDTEGECINLIEGNLKFSQDALKAVDFSSGKSIITFWIKQPEINQESGSISFSGGIPNGYCGRVPGDPEASNLVGKIIFKVPGTRVVYPGDNLAEIKFLDNSHVFLNDSKGTKATLVTRGASFEILSKLEIPSKNEWKEEIEKDNVLPEMFKIEISQDPTISGGKYFITFSTTDKQTGIDHYEIKEGKRDWKIATSPYVLEEQKLTSNIQVKAIDKAGNERTETLKTINETEKRWKIYIVLGLALIFVIIIFVIIVGWIAKTKKRKSE